MQELTNDAKQKTFPGNLLFAILPSAIGGMCQLRCGLTDTSQLVLSSVKIACLDIGESRSPHNHAGFPGSFTNSPAPPTLTFRFNNFSLLFFILYDDPLFILPVIPSLSPTRLNGLV